jgi:hypothetical protein
MKALRVRFLLIIAALLAGATAAADDRYGETKE